MYGGSCSSGRDVVSPQRKKAKVHTNHTAEETEDKYVIVISSSSSSEGSRSERGGNEVEPLDNETEGQPTVEYAQVQVEHAVEAVNQVAHDIGTVSQIADDGEAVSQVALASEAIIGC